MGIFDKTYHTYIFGSLRLLVTLRVTIVRHSSGTNKLWSASDLGRLSWSVGSPAGVNDDLKATNYDLGDDLWCPTRNHAERQAPQTANRAFLSTQCAWDLPPSDRDVEVLTLVMLNLFEIISKYVFIFWLFWTMRRCRQVNPSSVQDKELFSQHVQYHVCWQGAPFTNIV